MSIKLIKLLVFCSLFINLSIYAKKSVAIQNISGRVINVTVIDTQGIMHTETISSHQTKKFKIELELSEILIDDCIYEIQPHMHRTFYTYVQSGKLIPAPFYVRG